MSLVVTVKGSEGIVLAADSRVTLQAQGFPSTFDNATKLLAFDNPHNWVSAVICGTATIGGRTHYSQMQEFETTLGQLRLTVREYAQRLSDFFQNKWVASGQSLGADDAEFIVCGYDVGSIHGSVYRFRVPNSPSPVEVNDRVGLTWGGQYSVINRILRGYDTKLLDLLRTDFSFSAEQIESLRQLLSSEIHLRIPLDTLALQDCVDLSTFLIRTTIEAQSLSTDLRGVGGAIDVATLTQADGFKWVNRKQIQGG